MAARLTVTVRQVLEDGSESALDGELAAALEESAEQFAGLLTWAAEESGFLDHGEREEAIMREGRELERRLLQATFRLDAALEERAARVTSAAGVRHRTVEAGQKRGLASVFGPVKVTRMAYRHGHEENLYPADARSVMPGDPYSMGMRALAARHLAASGYGQAQEIIRDRTGVRIGHAQLAGIAKGLAAWTGDFYEERSRDAEEEEQPASDVIMMQGDGKGIAMRPEHRRNAGKDDGTRPGIKKMAATLASIAAKTRKSASGRGLDLTDVDRAVTYLSNNRQHMKYDRALENGWPIATGMIEGACRFVIEDRFGITGARWSPEGAEDILKIRAVVVNGDLDDYMRYYKQRYRDEHHLARYDPATIEDLSLAA